MSASTALAVFASLFWSIFVIGFGAKQKLQAVEWDLSTVTVADYAVEFAIPPDAYMNWYQEFYEGSGDSDNNVPVGHSLKKYLKDLFEQKLTDARLQNMGIDTSQNKRKLTRLN